MIVTSPAIPAHIKTRTTTWATLRRMLAFLLQSSGTHVRKFDIQLVITQATILACSFLVHGYWCVRMAHGTNCSGVNFP